MVATIAASLELAKQGNVLNPAYYELKAKESISSIIKYAGFKNIEPRQLTTESMDSYLSPIALNKLSTESLPS